METEYIVMTAKERMPLKCKGVYRKVAVVQVEKGVKPKMISPRARGVVQVVKIWRRLNVGKTDQCAFARALWQAYALRHELEKNS